MKLISFEGGVAAGKTSLTNYFAHELKLAKILENVGANHFITPFYEGKDVAFEVEMTFLMIHYQQLREAARIYQDKFVLADFSIEKDLVFARYHLRERRLEIFEHVYQYIISDIGLQHRVIFLQVSPKILRRRIFQRGRPYELQADLSFFTGYSERLQEYFSGNLKTGVSFHKVDDLVLDEENHRLLEIRKIIIDTMMPVQNRD